MTNIESKITSLSMEEIDLVDGAGPFADFFRNLGNALTGNGGNSLGVIFGHIFRAVGEIVDIFEP
jgi:phage-related protein